MTGTDPRAAFITPKLKLQQQRVAIMLRGGAAALALLLLAGSSTAEQPSPAFRRSAASLARLRGGSIVTNVGAGIIAGTGALAWISPSAAFEAVGMPNHDASALAFMRILG
eukprot:4405027-Prymnesium_polylepis.4